MRFLYIFVISVFSLLSATEPEPDAVYSRMVKSFTLNPDGTMEYLYSHTLKLNSYYATNRAFGETFITYDTTFQELNMLKSITTMADGRKVASPDNAYNIVLPAMAANAPAYNHLREMVVTHTGLETGSRINLEYTVTTKPGYLPGLAHAEKLYKEIPTDTLVLNITVPAGIAIQTDVIGIAARPAIEETDTQITHSWVFHQLPARVEEPASWESYPLILFSTLDSWEEAFKCVFDVETNTPEISSVVIPWFASLKTHSTLDLNFLLSVQQTVVSDLALIAVPLPAAGYRVRKPDTVWKSGAGTMTEKALLMQSILEGYKYPTRLWLVSNDARLNEQIPVPEYFNDAFLEVTLPGGKPVFFSVSAPQVFPELYARHNTVMLTLEDGKPVFQRIDINNLGTSSVTIDGTVDLAAGQPNGTLNCTLQGGFNPFYKLVKDKDALKAHLSGKANAMKVSSAAVKTLAETVLETDIDFTQDLGEYPDGQVIWTLPEPLNPLREIYSGSLQLQRRNGLKLNFPAESSMKLKVRKPASWTPLFTAADVIRENAVGTVEIGIKIRKNELIIKRVLKIVKTEVSSDEYDQFLELWRYWESPNYREFVFLKK